MERYRRNKPSSNRSGLLRTQESSDAEYSDFPPIRQRESSPPAPAVGVRSQGRPQPINVSSEEEPSPLRSRRPASAGLGSNNLANFEGKASPAKRAKVTPRHTQPRCSMLIRRMRLTARSVPETAIGDEAPRL